MPSPYCSGYYCLRPTRHCTVYILRSSAVFGFILSPSSYSNDKLPHNQVKRNSSPILPLPLPTFDVINIIIFIIITVLWLQCEMLIRPLLTIRKVRCGCHFQVYNLSVVYFWPGYLSRYSDSLRAWRSGYLIPVGMGFSASFVKG